MANFSVRNILKEHKYYLLDDGVPVVSTVFTALTIGNDWNDEMLASDTPHAEHQFSDYSGQPVELATTCSSCKDIGKEITIDQFAKVVQASWDKVREVREGFAKVSAERTNARFERLLRNGWNKEDAAIEAGIVLAKEATVVEAIAEMAKA